MHSHFSSTVPYAVWIKSKGVMLNWGFVENLDCDAAQNIYS